MKRFLLLSIFLFIIVTACGTATENTVNTENNDSTENVNNVEASEAKNVPKDFSIGTSIVTGTYYILAGPLSQLITEEIDGYTATHEATDGPANNLMLMENDEMYLALTSVLTAHQAFNGLG